jgi:hypothetical protein
MEFRESLSTDLPAPRDDEPAGLRQAILDELADHLACSYNRELLRGAKPGEARRRVIERFGDPAGVARRLWFDAMREKIMGQRVLIATCVMVTAACFGMVGLVWNQSNRSAAQAAEANRRLAKLLTEAQSTNQEMLRQLQAIAKASQSPRSPDWIPVTFRLAVEKPDGPPAVGYELALGRGQGGAAKPEAIHRRSDATGLADFGVVQPGDWEYSIQAGGWQVTGGLNAVPGTSVIKEIVCPKAPSDSVQLKVRVDWPASLADKNLVAVALFKQESETYQPPLVWGTDSSVQVICRPRGEPIMLSLDFEFSAKDSRRAEQSAPSMIGDPFLDSALAEGGIHGRIPSDAPIPSMQKAPLYVLAGRYSLVRLLLLRSLSDHRDTEAGEFELLTLMNQGQQQLQVRVLNEEMTPLQIGFLRGRPMKLSSPEPFGHFEVRPSQTAEWVISLPEEMIKEAEKRLKPHLPPKKAE